MDNQHDVEATDIKGSQVSATLRGFGHGWQGQQNSTNSVFIRGNQNDAPDMNEFLPEGLDSSRYKVIGNGVASPVSEWIGRRIIRFIDSQNIHGEQP